MAASETLFAAISGASSGDNTLVAAVAGKRIRVLGFGIVAAGAVTVAFESSTTSSLSGVMSLAANGDLSAHNPLGLFQTVAGELLNMTLGGAVQVSGWLTYQLID